MSALTITPEDVKGNENLNYPTVQAGEAITQADAIYRDPSTNKWMKTDATTAGKRKCEGIAMMSAEADGYFTVCTEKGARINIGATTVVGPYYAGANSTTGSHSPFADLTTGDAIIPSFVAEDTAGNVSLMLHSPTTEIVIS